MILSQCGPHAAMKSSVTLLLLLGLIAATAAGNVEQSCFISTFNDCIQSSISKPVNPVDVLSCTAQFGGVSHGNIFTELYTYVNMHIEYSFHYLLMSTYFGNAERNRGGFEKLFRILSDGAWEDAQELIKYATKRGGTVTFENTTPLKIDTYEQTELVSLGRALDMQKTLALKAHHIHSRVSRKDFTTNVDGKIVEHKPYDPDTASFLENHFLHKQSETIRALAGHMSDLKQLLELKSRDTTVGTTVYNNDKEIIHLGVFLFDEQLEKQLQ